MTQNHDPAMLAKAETLTEALPYLQRYAGKTFVVKYGGHAMGDPEAARDFAEVAIHCDTDGGVVAGLSDASEGRELEIIRRIESDARGVFFPIEARIIAPDDAWLSPFYERESGSIAVHVWYKEDHDWMFRLAEPVFREAGGRPHWGKLHSLGAQDFKQLYPQFAEADAIRRSIDPDGRMLNPFLKRIFG